MSNPPKKLPEPLKIHISSFATPTTVQSPTSTPLTPKPPIAPKQTPPPVQKNIPIPPPNAPKPLTTNTSTPTVVSPVVTRLAPPAPAQVQPQLVVQAPSPRVIEVPKAPSAPPPPPVNMEKEFLNAHLGEIRGLLVQNMKYPKMAQKLKMQGEVRVSFSLSSDGNVENIKIIESSGFEVLDEDAAKLIEKTASTFPKPSKSVRITVPLSYVLR